MTQRPKIMIQKKIVLDAKGHFRFYSPYYDPTKKFKRRAAIFTLEPLLEYNKYGEPYPYVNIRTEKQLVTFLANTFGYGDYLIFAFLKGKEGTYIFWKGEVYEDGWIFKVQESTSKEVEKLKDELTKCQDSDEAETIKEDIQFWSEINKEEKSEKRYGFAPFLRASGRRGEFNSWQDQDLGLMPKVNTTGDINQW